MLNVTDTKRERKRKKKSPLLSLAASQQKEKKTQIIEISSRRGMWPCDCDTLFLGNKNSEVEE